MADDILKSVDVDMLVGELGEFRQYIPNTGKGFVTVFHYNPVDGVTSSEQPAIAWCVKDDKIVDVLTLPVLKEEAVYCFSAATHDGCRHASTFPDGHIVNHFDEARRYAAAIFIGTVPHWNTNRNKE